MAGGLLWLTEKPTPLPGDRYELPAIVLNLTGTGDAARQCVLGTAEWTLRPIEINLETLDAGELLEEMVAGRVPMEMLALIPLMRRGGEAGIMQRWLEVVDAETHLRRRADYALAQIFAERAGHPEVWHNALKGLNMIESPMIAELLAEAESRAKTEARTETKAETLLRVIKKRYRELPAELATSIHGCTEDAKLDRWLDVALETETLAQFRQQTGL